MLAAISPSWMLDTERTTCGPCLAHDNSTCVPAVAGDVRDTLATTGSPTNTDVGITFIDDTLIGGGGGGGGAVSVCSHVSPKRLSVISRPPKRAMVRRGASYDMAWEKRGRGPMS